MTFAELRDLARQKADEEASTFVTPSELNSYLNQGLKSIYLRIVSRYEDHFLTEGTALNGGLFSQVSGTASYSLPTDLIKLVTVQVRQQNSSSENDYYRIDRVNISNNGIDLYYPLREDQLHKTGYFLTKDKIFFRPVPTRADQVRLWYIPRPTAMSADSDEPVVPEEYHELLAEFAAIQCLRKTGEGIFTESMTIWKEEMDMMLESIENRDQQAKQMVITEDFEYETYSDKT